MNCIRKAVKTGRLRSDRAVTVGQLLSLENLGQSTLLEVMCVAEAAIDSGFLSALEGVESTAPHPSPSQPAEPVDCTDGWDHAITLLKKLLAVEAEFRGSHTLADALSSDLGALMSMLGLANGFDDIPLDELVSGPSMAEEALLALEEFLGVLSPLERLVFEHRVATRKPLSLKRVGQEANLTRERIRQVQKALEKNLRHPGGMGADVQWWLGAIAAIVHQSAGPVTAESELEDRISAFFPDGGQVRSTASVARAARQLLRKELGYRCTDGVCLDAAAFAVVENLKATARSIADDAGLIDEQELRAHLLDETWWPHWETLVGQCRLHRLSDRLALRDTKKARLKAALLLIGRPATKEELREICGAAAPTRVSNYLSAMTGVVRADKKRWGLAEWVEDEYEGIPAEIVQRIEEDAGATRLERLIEELPRLFGVSENSVRSFCNAAMFVVDDGWIRLRGDHEPYSYKNPDVAYARGVFALGDRRVGLLYEVDHDVLRGSGRHLPHAAAAILRVRVNDRLHFTGPANTAVTVTFPGTAHQGPSLGSSRALAEAASATCGDMMAVVLDAGKMTVSVTVTDVNEYRPGWALIARLTGINEQSGIEGLAGALKCNTGEVRAMLRSRGDLVVFGAMPPRRMSPDLDDALAKLEAEVHRGATL